MQMSKRQNRQKSGSVIFLPVDEIIPNPNQPRRIFQEERLRELAESISQIGVINPLSVRPKGGRYELVAGERRLRAAKLAGLREGPCILLDVNMEESSLLALVENLQRQDLNFVEEAEGIARLIRTYSMSQGEAANRLGKSQSAVANKLRLLKLPSDVLETLLLAELTERHGRALLRLGSAESQRAALRYIIENALTVAATEAYVEQLLTGTALKADAPEPTPDRARNRTMFVLKDVRIFLNTLTRSLDMMKQGGIGADLKRQETDSELILTISIPKKKG
ncbi:MAG: ParB/RepB/Spo0J family partition protein [Firmicutes bacterium]|nr:ParB/RepB/Spo0J family partition protein [Bacillota bacterium]